ncbi:efflux RND transporter permease subunit [Gloeobacter violaceus]|uniref:AcrB/AcrD/AcrF family protein n=1 Tax=Gloeobacter violaceus (strain ATCC 29082 / PCC 7421) TaxID=251221 RepID=Q7NL29_GLOVI|nr:efflux RND transporter permease subunit [Gloeobacter violaceus]BAC89238.1 AcrB/AcrD/AcrF family protein [Gloeobacter violaceus PCC 7421]
MTWNLSAWSIRNPVPTIALFLLLTAAGVAAFVQLPIAIDPDVQVPKVSVTVTQLGAAPPELETQVTRKIEDAVAGIGNIRHITSQIKDGSSSTEIEFLLGTNFDRAVNDVRDAVAKIRSSLPQSIDQPVIRRVEASRDAETLVEYEVLSASRSVKELSWIADNDVTRAMLAVPGVARVWRSGGVTREIRVQLDPNRLQALGITALDVDAQIRSLNTNLPGGRGEVGTTEQAIRTLGSASTVEQLRTTQISLGDGRHARLDTLGRITDGESDPDNLAFLNRVPVVYLGAIRSSGSNLVAVEEAIDAKMRELARSLPAGVEIRKSWTNATFVRESYSASVEALLLGASLAVVVIWLFLRDGRATFIAGLAIPLSVIPTFAVMKLAGFTLNNMTLLALALVVGILVDDAIVEIENIIRHTAMGKSPFQAALDAADEIGLAVVATTMTIVAVFLPVAFMEGIQGQYFRQFGWSVAAAVLFSLLVARMLTPLMAAYWMKPLPHTEQKSFLVRAYDYLLIRALQYRNLTVVLAAGVFALSLWLWPQVPTSLVNAADDGEIDLYVLMPPGTPIEQTRQSALQMSALMEAHPAVDRVFSGVGTFGDKKNQNLFFIYLKPKEQRRLNEKQVEAELRSKLEQVPGVRLSFAGSSFTGGKELQIVLQSDDSIALERSGSLLVDQMRSVPGLTDVNLASELARPELRVVPNLARAADQGVSVEAIARTALVATLGDNPTSLAKFNLPGRQINIRVLLDPRFRQDLQAIENLQLTNGSGQLVPLKAVADIRLNTGISQIERYDRSRKVTVEANLAPGSELGPALARVHQLPALRNLPAGVREKATGDAEVQKDVFNGFGGAIAVAVLLVYAVLVLLFGGFLQPLTIMISLPLALGGALVGLLLMGKSMGMYALIGIVMLMGLVTKNAILLVEYCLMAMKGGRSRLEAIMSAGETRLRPILMTTVAMIAGMLPIALSLGAGAETRSPMAIAVVGGLVTSTLLTLVVVPVVFTYIDDLEQWLSIHLDRTSQQDRRQAIQADNQPDLPVIARSLPTQQE